MGILKSGRKAEFISTSQRSLMVPKLGLRFTNYPSQMKCPSQDLRLFIYNHLCLAGFQIVSVQVHHLNPGGYKVVHKFVAGICASVYFGNGSQFRVGAE